MTSHIPKPVIDPNTSTNFMQKLKFSKNLTWHEIMGNSILAEQNLHFALNINMQIFECIAGAETLEHLGFELPECVRFSALQKNNLCYNIEVVTKMLHGFNDIVKQLTVPQVILIFVCVLNMFTLLCTQNLHENRVEHYATRGSTIKRE